MKKKYSSFLIHFLAVLTFLSLPIVFSPDKFSIHLIDIPPFRRDFCLFFFLLIAFYIQFYILLPKFWFEVQKVNYFISFIVLFVLIFISLELIEPSEFYRFRKNHFQNAGGPPFGPPDQLMFFSEFGKMIFNYFVITIAAYVIHLYVRNKKMEKEKVQLELNFLREQIHPHFLFNTLNSIYSISIKEKAPSTSTAILQLADILRFNLKGSSGEFISMSDELNYIKAYINLQKLRCSELIQIEVNIDVPSTTEIIIPFVLISFIENAFKFGINPDYSCFIKIDISLSENKELIARIFNRKVPVDNLEGHGIGLYSTEKRLEHYYKDRYSISIEETTQDFAINFKLQL